MNEFTYADPRVLCGNAGDCPDETGPNPPPNAGRFKNWALRVSGAVRADEPADSGDSYIELVRSKIDAIHQMLEGEM